MHRSFGALIEAKEVGNKNLGAERRGEVDVHSGSS